MSETKLIKSKWTNINYYHEWFYSTIKKYCIRFPRRSPEFLGIWLEEIDWSIRCLITEWNK